MRRPSTGHDCVRLAWVMLTCACTAGVRPDDADAAPPSDGGHASETDAARTGADAGAPGDGGEPSDTLLASDAGPPPLHGCIEFEDRRADDADRTVRFDSSPSLAYTPPCILVAVGQLVAFEGPFFRHALAPGRSPRRPAEPVGSPDNPIPATEAGTRIEATFLGPGLFPFYCSTHDLSGMVGVVRVE